MEDQKTAEQIVAEQIQAQATQQLRSEIDYLSNIIVRIIDGRSMNVSMNALIETLRAYGVAMPTQNREVLISSLMELGTILLQVNDTQKPLELVVNSAKKSQ